MNIWGAQQSGNFPQDSLADYFNCIVDLILIGCFNLMCLLPKLI